MLPVPRPAWLVTLVYLGPLLFPAAPSFGKDDTWTPKASLHTARYMPGAAVSNGKIYVMGGLPNDSRRAVRVVEVYDPATDTWTDLDTMPEARSHFCYGSMDGSIFAAGRRVLRGDAP